MKSGANKTKLDKLIDDEIARMETIVDLTCDWEKERNHGFDAIHNEIKRLKRTVECTPERSNRYRYLNELCEQMFDALRAKETGFLMHNIRRGDKS
jgi:hypothetical protein